MVERLNEIRQLVGNTPMQKCVFSGINLYAKLEYHNFTGSVKDRAALNVLLRAAECKAINSSSTIIESSSGNMAIALASLCRQLGLKFIAVIDKNINATYENVLQNIASEVIKIEEPDETGGYLLSRIAFIKTMVSQSDNIFWTNQYENPDNYMAYYDSMGPEISRYFPRLDYVFVSVSSGGTITGLSMYLKKQFKDIKVVAVDVEGSMIFQCEPAKRYISGIGSSMRSPILDNALIDEIILVSQREISVAAHELLREQSLYCGASSAACYHAVKEYLKHKAFSAGDNVLFICPDKGYAYFDNIYDPVWINKFLSKTVPA